jgi:hypothetical protein
MLERGLVLGGLEALIDRTPGAHKPDQVSEGDAARNRHP